MIYKNVHERVCTRSPFVCTLLFLFAFLVSVPVQSSPGKDKPDGSAEIISKRTRTSRHFKNADGTITMITSAGSLNYMDAKGQWQKIETGITKNETDNQSLYPYVNTTNVFHSFFPQYFGAAPVLSKLEGAVVSEAVSAGYYFSAGSKIFSRSEAGAAQAQVSDNTVLYGNVFPKVDARYTIGNDQRKLDWILNNRSIVDAAPDEATEMVIYESLQIPQSWTVRADGEAIYVLNTFGLEVIRYEQPFAYESANPPVGGAEEDYMHHGSYRLLPSANGWIIETVMSMAWLRASHRKYPVVIDPTANYYPANTTNWTGYQTSATSKSSGMMRVTNGLNVGWAKFDISSLPASANISVTRLYSYHYTTTGTKDARINDMNATEPVSASASAISSAIAANDSYITNYPFGGTSYGWRNAVLGSAANADIAARISQGWTAVGFAYFSGSTTFMYHYGWNGTFKPYLEITYQDALVNVGVTQLVSPLSNMCGTGVTNIVAKVKNFSVTDSVKNLDVVCVISGDINQVLYAQLSRTLYGGAEDTVVFAQQYNTLQGANLSFTIYTDYGNDPAHADDTLKTNVLINGLPYNASLRHHVSSQGKYLSGLVTDPDHVKAGDSMVYVLTPPNGLTDAQYGSAWTVSSVSVKTPAGTSMASVNHIVSAAGQRLLVLKPATVETDSMYDVRITFQLVATGCDTLQHRWLYIAPVPVLNFTNGKFCVGTNSVFQNTSQIIRGTIKYHWDFGTGSQADTSNSEHPLFVFGAHGLFTVSLTGVSDLGYSKTITRQVYVGATPKAGFDFDNVCLGHAVVFADQSTVADTSTLYSDWQFGDASGATVTNPSHLYATVGVFATTLRITTSYGCSSSITLPVNVLSVPAAGFTFTHTCAGDNINFVNTTPALADIGYKWDFGDGTITHQQTPQKKYAAPGTYQVKLVALTDFGCRDSIVKTINIFPVPVAIFSSSGVCANDSILFANTSTVATGTITASVWDFGNQQDDTNNNATVAVKYLQPGSYTVTLRVVSDALCSAERTETIVVKESPVAGFTQAAILCRNTEAVFADKTIFTSGNLQYDWSFGDGQISSLVNPKVTYVSSGSYVVKLKVRSTDGCSDSVSAGISVNELPDASFAMSVVNPGQRQVSFTPTVAGHDNYEWSFGDGNVLYQVNPVYSYLSNGPFTVQLKTTDMNGCVGSSSKTVAFNVSTGKATIEELCIYPNPVNTQTTIKWGSNMVVSKIELMNDLGQIVFVPLHLGATEAEMEMQNLPAGVYYIRILGAEETYTKRITKM